MGKILIFGATGDTGQYLVDYLLEIGISSEKILASGSRKQCKFFEKRNIEYISIDISNFEEFVKIPKDVDTIVDLAGYMPARMQGYHPNKYFEINTIGTLNILEFCRVNQINKFIYATSFGDILKNLDNHVMLNEDMPINYDYTTDHTAYVISKNAAVELIKNYHYKYNLNTIIFRLPTIYLMSDIDTYYVDGVERKIGYRQLIEKAIKGEKIEVYGDINRVKDMVYVKDFCQMIAKAIASDVNYGMYNVGTGVGTKLIDIVEGIVEVFGSKGCKSEVILRPDMPDTPQYIMDISKAKKELGYEPKYDFIAMLEDMKKIME